MRTPEEIREYLKSQKWYDLYEDNLLSMYKNGVGEQFLKGEKGYQTIRTAFIWDCTAQGKEYWEAIDKEFQKWYGKKPSLTIKQKLKIYSKATAIFLGIVLLGSIVCTIIRVSPDWLQIVYFILTSISTIYFISKLIKEK